MKKPVFETSEYKGSICHISTLNCNNAESLQNKLKASQGAVLHHKRMKNQGQVKFFQSDVDLINKKLSK